MDTNNDIKARVATLESLILRYQKSYYAGREELDDSQFDALWDELKSLSPTSPVLQKVGSDLDDTSIEGATLSNNKESTPITSKAKKRTASKKSTPPFQKPTDKQTDSANSLSNTVSDFPKLPHIMVMGSQEKCSTIAQFTAWALKHDYKEYLVEYKLDGASLELQYESGILVRALTRGDGSIGDDITPNAKKMSGVLQTLTLKPTSKKSYPLTLMGSVDFTGAIRGEVLMTHKTQKTLFPEAKNCRNAAAGIMKRLDGVGCESLTLITYDAFSPRGAKDFFCTEREKLDFLKEVGFCVAPLKVCHSAQEVIDYRAQIAEQRAVLDIDIDGLVIKEDAINEADKKRARPERQVAFKFELEKASSVLKDVEWSENGATYTPVAIFPPVKLNGTTVTRASLVNPDTIKALDVKIGSTIIISKRGEIIPKVEEALNSEGTYLSPIPIPTTCSTCGAPLSNCGTRLFCPNKACQKRIKHQIAKWASVLDILELGDILIEKLVDTKTVLSIMDLYKLTETSLRPFFITAEEKSKASVSPRVSPRISLGAKRVLASLNEKRVVSLAQFAAGFDIDGFGQVMAEKIVAAGHNTLQKLLALTEKDLCAIPGFAQIMAKTVTQGLAEYKEQMEALAKTFITIKKVSEGELSGASFCFTGELHSLTRKAASEKVLSKGGTCKNSVTKGLTYLVTNDTTSGSAKNARAKELGVKVINEEEFLEMVK